MKPLVVVVLVACGGKAPPAPDDRVSGPLRHEAATVPCIAAGTYKVTVDLSNARITGPTGSDTEWCKSMLMAVPAAQMSTLRIDFEADGALVVRWPPSREVQAAPTASPCTLAIADDPIPMTITFAGGGNTAEGVATYALATADNPDERCTATHAKFVLERAGT